LGFESYGLTVNYSQRTTNDGLRVFPRKWMLGPEAVSRVRSADVVVWYGGSPMYGIERLAKGVCIFNGAELRTPEAERDNPWYRQGEYPIPDPAKVLQRFNGWDIVAENPSVLQYSGGWYFGRGVFPSDLMPSDGGSVVHVGSQPLTKGTDYVVRQVPGVIVLRNIPRAEALAEVAACRVYVGQFVLGDLGMAEIEAMYLGKPVVSWVKPSLLHHYPSLPIVNVDGEGIEEAVEWLRSDASARQRIGAACRDYAFEHFNPLHVSERRASLYEFGPH
jgi:hypothetical protein